MLLFDPPTRAPHLLLMVVTPMNCHYLDLFQSEEECAVVFSPSTPCLEW